MAWAAGRRNESLGHAHCFVAAVLRGQVSRLIEPMQYQAQTYIFC
jgi:hypothetical protein